MLREAETQVLMIHHVYSNEEKKGVKDSKLA